MLVFERAIYILRRPRRINLWSIDIPLFLNSLDIFAESILVLWSLLQLLE